MVKIIFSLVFLFYLAGPAYAEKLLITLKSDTRRVGWHEDFLVSLEIYGEKNTQLPEIAIYGMERFRVNSQGKNVLHVPGGKTVKWIFTFNLTAVEEGYFRIGPAVAVMGEQRFSSNMIFITVDPPPGQAPKEILPPAMTEKKQKEERPAGKEKDQKRAIEKKEPEPARSVPPKEKTKPEPAKSLPPKEKTEPEPAKSPPPKQKPKPEPVKTPPPKPSPPAQGKIAVPLIHSAQEIGNKILISMETARRKMYRLEGITVTLRLLSQFPIDDLRYEKEPDFPGFLKYDFPFTANPKAQPVKFQGEKYASFELRQFLLFPLSDGEVKIEPVKCLLKVRVPSGAYSAADLMLNAVRNSNHLALQVLPLPGSEDMLVGNFLLKNELLSDLPQSKVLRLVLEGNGQVSTFSFPDLTGRGYKVQVLSTSASAALQNGKFRSRKTRELEVLPASDHTTSVVIPELQVRQFDPGTQAVSVLALPQVPLRFSKKSPPRPRAAPLPSVEDSNSFFFYLPLFSISVIYLVVLFWPQPKIRYPRLTALLKRKNPKLQISKNAARLLYQQITIEVLERDYRDTSLTETLKQHIPQSEWLNVLRVFRRLETNAFSPSSQVNLTYGDLKSACERVERLWYVS